MRKLTSSECMDLMESQEDLLLVDLRSLKEFCTSFIPGSMPWQNGLDERMRREPLFPKGEGVVFIVPSKGLGSVDAAFPDMTGWKILGSMPFDREEWMQAGGSVDMVIGVEADELAMDIPYDDRLVIVDVREPMRYAEGHAAGAVNLPLASLFDPGSMAMIQESENLYIHGEGEAEGVLAAALLKRQGIHNLRVVEGGWEAIEKEKGIDREKDPGKLN